MLHETHVNTFCRWEKNNNKRQGLFLLKNSFPEGKAKQKVKQHLSSYSTCDINLWNEQEKERKTFICLVTAVFLDYVPYEHWKIRV